MNNILVQSTNNAIATINIEDRYTNTLSPETKRAYTQAIQEFFGKKLSEITVIDMQSVTPDHANQYALALENKGLTHATINRKLAALHSFYQFLCRRTVAIMNYNPFSTDEGSIRFKNAQKDYSDKKALTPEEVKKVFDAARQDESISGVRDLLILELLATTGMRRAEICDIKIGDIQDTAGKYIAEIKGKGNKSRIIVFSKGVTKVLKQYMEMREITLANKDEYLLVSHANRKSASGKVSTNMIYRVVKHYCGLAGIDESLVSPHCLRHGYATNCIEMGMNITDVKDLMGHSSIHTTARYVKSYNLINKNPANKLDELYEC